MGYRGKRSERQQARQLRRAGLPLAEIAVRLGVSKSSVSVWVRDVSFDPLPRPPRGRRRAPNALQRRQAEIDRLVAEGRERIGRLSEREFLVAGVALYAGEGTKRDGAVRFANSDPRMIFLFCCWLRRFFEIDESRLRVRLYLHEGLDLAATIAYWSGDGDSARTVREAIPGGPGPFHPPCQACARLRHGQLQLQRNPPKHHGVGQCAPEQ